ncbi:MAG TPA: MFS transporter [Sphingomicrobium sp.]
MATGTITRRASSALILLLGAAVFLNYVDRGAISIAAPLMKSELGLSAAAYGTAFSAFYWIYAPVQLVIGWLCDRFSVYRLVALGIVIWAASTLMMGFVGGFLSLTVLRVMLGVGESIIFPGSSKIIVRHVPAEERGMANAWCAAGLSIGPAAGTLIGGIILANSGWRAIFIVFGLVTLTWLLPWQREVRRLPRVDENESSDVPVRKVLGQWSLWAMSIGHAASNFAFYFLLAFTPLYLVQHEGMSIQLMTLVTTLGYATQGATAFAIGIWSDRWTRSGRSEARIRRVFLTVGQVLTGVALVAITMTHDALMIGTLLCVAGFATAFLPTNLYAVAQMFAGPRAAGTWVGLQNGFGNISGIIGPVIQGILIDQKSYDAAFYLAAAVAVFGGFWWAVCVPPIRQVDLD